MLYDKNFLLELDKSKNKIIYAKVTALSFEELPITAIEGRVTQGSINLDGASAVRRSCSLSMVAQDFDYSDYSWGLNTKFKLEIGVKNFVNPLYPDIIWFNQGIYIITSFNTSRSTNNFTISLQGKDKMCLLNGEVSGTIGVQTDFGTIEEEDSQGVWTIRPIPIPEIIKNLVHSYGGEPYHNIIIKDLNTYGLELLEYRYDNVDLVLYRYSNSNTYINVALGNNRNKKFRNVKTGTTKTISEFDDDEFETLTDAFIEGNDYPTFIEVDKNGNQIGDKSYVFTRIKYGETAGYRMTDLTYAGDLIANVGESITSVLDKIKNMLVEFEYFYDVDGRFVFQKKQSFINTLWQPTADANNINTEYETTRKQIEEDQETALNEVYEKWKSGEIETEKEYFEQMKDIKDYYDIKLKQCSNLYKVASGDEVIQESLALASTTAYDFQGGELITGFNNNPNLLNLKNDYSIWGERTSVSGAAIPVHLRYAIDVKPIEYTTITLTDGDKEEITEYNKKYGTTLKSDQTSTLYSTIFPLYHCKSCGKRKIQPVAVKEFEEQDVYVACPVCGKTNLAFEDYKYVKDWREILHIMATDYFRYNTLENFEIRVREANPEIYPSGRTGYEQYYTDIEVCWRQLYNNELGTKIQEATEAINKYQADIKTYEDAIVEQEKVLTNANKALTTESAKEEPSQTRIDELYIAAMAEAQSLRDLQTLLNKSQHQLDQTKEKLDSYESNIENYYQIDEVPQTDYSTAYYTLPDNISILTDENIKITYTFTQDGKRIADYCFHIPLTYVSVVSEPNPTHLKLLYSPKDDLYLKITGAESSYYHCRYYDIPRLYWNKNVYTAPNTLNYWFDFLDTEGELSQFNVKTIGSRTKAVNETTIKSIYFRETPAVIYGAPQGEGLSGYKYINVNKAMMDNMFTISAQGKSAKDRLDELLYAHGYCSESATVTTIPIYYLQPNTRIHISDPQTNLDGDYIVSKITIPLTYNGTMQLTTTKAAETLFL